MFNNKDTRLRRTLLFVPGTNPDRFSKAIGTGADSIIFDLEDSVSIDLKNEARKNVLDFLKSEHKNDTEFAVRINPHNTKYFQEDLEKVVEAKVDSIVVPKSEDAYTLKNIADFIAKNSPNKDIRILALVETALGVTQINQIISATSKVDAVCFGHADFSLDMGLTDNDATRGVIYYARCSIAIAARAYKASPIDNVCLAVKDEDAFKNDVNVGISLGYEGKLCIHPAQVKIANDLYTPTSEQINYAKRVIEGWDEAKAQGKGVFTIDNKMVDAPIVALQKKVLDRAKKAGVL